MLAKDPVMAHRAMHMAAVKIASAVHAGGTRFEIQLDPPELGRIEVRMESDKGNAQARLSVERPETLDIYARILKPGGQLIMSTDVPYLAEWMLTHSFNHPAFTWTAKSASDWRIPPEDWVHTAYETKRAKGADKMVYLFFERLPKS